LDVGCGAGIFSFCFLYKNIYEKNNPDANFENFNPECFNSTENIEYIDINLYLSDIDDECVYSTFINFNNYKKFFIEKVFKLEEKNKLYKFNLSFIEISRGDLVKNFAFSEKYYGYFDIILANLPQTPSEESIRSIFLFIFIYLYLFL
jgi:hypothetical protein